MHFIVDMHGAQGQSFLDYCIIWNNGLIVTVHLPVFIYFCVLIVVDTSAEKADELDKALIQLEHGVDIAMQVRK